MKIQPLNFICLIVFTFFIIILPSCKNIEKTVSFDQKGTIIILHGISSVGKTSTAKQIQLLMNTPYAYVGIDTMNSLLPEWLVNLNPSSAEITSRVKQDGLSFEPVIVNGEQILVVKIGSFVKKYLMILPEILVTFAKNNVSCIADIGFVAADTIINEDLLKKYVKDLHGYKVYFINLKVSPNIAAQREQDRGGFRGLAAGQQYSLYKNLNSGSFDLEIDTSDLKPELIARIIVDFIGSHKEPQAFNTLYKNYY